jgi:hypothetical protein
MLNCFEADHQELLFVVIASKSSRHAIPLHGQKIWTGYLMINAKL